MRRTVCTGEVGLRLSNMPSGVTRSKDAAAKNYGRIDVMIRKALFGRALLPKRRYYCGESYTFADRARKRYVTKLLNERGQPQLAAPRAGAPR